MRSMCEQIKALKKETAEPTRANEILNSADNVKQPPCQPRMGSRRGGQDAAPRPPF